VDDELDVALDEDEKLEGATGGRPSSANIHKCNDK